MATRGRALLGAALRGATSGLAGVAVMTVGEQAEQSLTKRPDSFVPARALRALLSSTTPEAVRQTTRILETAAAMDDAAALVADHSGAR